METRFDEKKGSKHGRDILGSAAHQARSIGYPYSFLHLPACQAVDLAGHGVGPQRHQSDPPDRSPTRRRDLMPVGTRRVS